MSNCFTDIIICNNDSLGQNSVYICFFVNNVPLFSEIFISIDEYAN